MKYIKLFEKFTKEYQNKIDLKDFKKIKKGSMIQYMGGAVEVVDNNGYVLKLKDDDGKIFTVNKSQFDHGGRISEVSDGKKKKKKKEFHPDMMYELKRTLVSGTMSGSTESLEDRKYELKKDAKGATIGSFSNVTLPKGTIIYNLPGGVFADHFSLKNKYASRSSQGPQYFDKPTFKGIMIKQTPAVLSYIEKNSKVLESVNESAMSELDLLAKEAKDFKAFTKEVFKEFKNLPKKADTLKWLEELYNDAINEAEKAEGDRSKLSAEIEKALKDKATESGVPIGLLRLVMRRGLDAWNSSHRAGVPQVAWGYARVNAFLEKGKGTWGKADADIAKEVRDEGKAGKLPIKNPSEFTKKEREA